MSLSEKTISAIARALLNDRKALDKSLAYWSAPGRRRVSGKHIAAISRDLRENATALVELADGLAPWLKQLPDWQTIITNESTTTTKEPV